MEKKEKCPICNSKKVKKFKEFGNYFIVCSKCGYRNKR